MGVVISNPTHLDRCTTGRLHGRATAGTGPGEELTPAQARSLMVVYSTTEVDALVGSIDLSGYVPYTGATTNLNMGAFGVTAASVTVPNSGGRTDAVLTRSSLRIGQESGNQYGYMTSDSSNGLSFRWNSTTGAGFAIASTGLVPITNGGFSLGLAGFGWNLIQLHNAGASAAIRTYDFDTVDIRNGTNSAAGNLTCAALTASGDISMQKTSAQGYIYAYQHNDLTKYIRLTSVANEQIVDATTTLSLTPGTSGIVSIYEPTVQPKLRLYDLSVGNYTEIQHNGTNGVISTSSGNLNLTPTGGTVAVTGAFTATTSIGCGAASNIAWMGRSIMQSPSDGIVRFYNNASSQGFCIDYTTSVAKFRNTVDSADINITAGAATFSSTVDATGKIASSVGISPGPITFAVLNALTATATLGVYRITDRNNRWARPDGTNWRFMDDDAIIS